MAFEGLSEKLNATFKHLRGKGRLSEEDIKLAMREVRLALLEADVSYKVVKDFVKTVSERAVGAEVLDSLTPAQQVIKIVSEELTALMGGANAKLTFASRPPTVVMMCGLQGSGKTTHSAKLAKMNADQKHQYEMEKLQKENAELKRSALRMELGKTATGLLKEHNVDATQDILDFVVGENAEETKERIDRFVSIVQAQLKRAEVERATGRTPKTVHNTGNAMSEIDKRIAKYQ